MIQAFKQRRSAWIQKLELEIHGRELDAGSAELTAPSKQNRERLMEPSAGPHQDRNPPLSSPTAEITPEERRQVFLDRAAWRLRNEPEQAPDRGMELE